MGDPLGRRRRTSTVMVWLAAACLLGAGVLGYAWRAAFDAQQFGRRTADALRRPPVRDLAAVKLTDDVVLGAAPDAIAARPLIESVARSVVGGAAFSSLAGSAAADLHRSVLDRSADTATLTVVDAGVVLAAAAQKLDPKAAASLRARRPVELYRVRLGTLGGDLARAADRLRLGAVVLLIAGIALAAGAVALAPDRRRVIGRAGWALAVGALGLLAAYWVGRALALGSFDGPDARAAAGGVWDAFLGDLRNGLLLVAAIGALVAATASSLVRARPAGAMVRRMAHAVGDEPASTPLRVVRAVALIAAGALAVLEPDVALRLTSTVAGLLVAYVGIEALMRLLAPPPGTPAPVRGRGRAARDAPRRRFSRRRGGIAGLAAALTTVAVVAFAGSGGASAPAQVIRGCNGHTSLCGRRLDELVLPATHNAMSVPLPGWFAAEQDRPISGQLEDGIRGLLIDTHYGVELAGGRVRTELENPENPSRQKFVDGVGANAVDAALRLRKQAGFSGSGKRGLFLCHTFCEVGATPLADGLRDVHDFLVTHPSDVLVIVNQDAITPDDFAGAMDRAGLLDYAYRGSVDGPWPTLRQMIESGQRLVVFAEEDAGRFDWYHSAYAAALQETPYTFNRAADLTDPALVPATCREYRGPASAPLFLINHWVSTDPLPRPSDASKVNAYEPLLRRAQTCGRLRHRVPTLLAVNFYRRGDLLRVVDKLNGVR